MKRLVENHLQKTFVTVELSENLLFLSGMKILFLYVASGKVFLLGLRWIFLSQTDRISLNIHEVHETKKKDEN